MKNNVETKQTEVEYMALKDYRFDGSGKLNLKKLPTNSSKDKVDKEEILKKTEKNQLKIQELQDRTRRAWTCTALNSRIRRSWRTTSSGA